MWSELIVLFRKQKQTDHDTPWVVSVVSTSCKTETQIVLALCFPQEHTYSLTCMHPVLRRLDVQFTSRMHVWLTSVPEFSSWYPNSKVFLLNKLQRTTDHMYRISYVLKCFNLKQQFLPRPFFLETVYCYIAQDSLELNDPSSSSACLVLRLQVCTTTHLPQSLFVVALGICLFFCLFILFCLFFGFWFVCFLRLGLTM